MTHAEPLPFAGLRVLSFCIGAVAPEISRWFAEYGADAVKVESRVFPELMRRVANMPGAEGETSAGFSDANRAKLSVAIDMTNAEGQEVARRLAAKADVIVENYRGDVMKNWGLDYARVAALNPSVVYCSSQGFGRGGPDENYPTMGPNLAPAFGLFSLWGHPEEAEPLGAMLNHPDHVAGKMGMIAVLAALDERQRTGRGRFIDLSQAEAGALMMGEAYLEHFLNGREAPRRGNASPNAAPHGAYPCRGEDRWCVVSVRGDDEWLALCDLIGWDDLAADKGLRTLAGRLARSAEIDARLAEWTAGFDAEEAAEALQAAGVPAGFVMNARDFLTDRHLAERGAIVEIDHPVTGPRKYLANSGFRIEGFQPLDTVRAPLLGEHTDDVLRRWLRMKDGEIAALRAARAIGY